MENKGQTCGPSPGLGLSTRHLRAGFFKVRVTSEIAGQLALTLVWIKPESLPLSEFPQLLGASQFQVRSPERLETQHLAQCLVPNRYLEKLNASEAADPSYKKTNFGLRVWLLIGLSHRSNLGV